LKSNWLGLLLIGLVVYFGLVGSLSNPQILLNSHAVILVCGGTIAVSLLSYSYSRLVQVTHFVIFGFLFRMKKTDVAIAKDLINHIDRHYTEYPTFPLSADPHPFLTEAFRLLENRKLSSVELRNVLRDRRNAIRRRYVEDAKILNNIAKYPPHLGLLGAASGMIEMMTGLGKDGVDTIGSAMAVALSATLWGIGLNNFVFLPLSDNSLKSAEDEIYLRDIIIECSVLISEGATNESVVNACFNRLSLAERASLKEEYQEICFKRVRNAA
jgi:flagellar motor component MotA